MGYRKEKDRIVRPIHLDTDIGGDTDDLCALAMLLGWPGVELVGVTTCSDSGGLRAGLARYALRLAGREDVPVAAGADGSLGGHRIAPGSPTRTVSGRNRSLPCQRRQAPRSTLWRATSKRARRSSVWGRGRT